MSVTDRSRVARIAVVASGAMLLFGGAGFAQTVRVFDDAPSVEQLRSILTPESPSGAVRGRSIVIMRPDVGASAGVQHVSTQMLSAPQMLPTPQMLPAPRKAVASEATPAQPVVHAAASVPVQALSSAPKHGPDAGAVAFHINFAFNSAVLPDSAHAMIGRMAQFMKESPDVNIRVEGHTDAVGAAGYNAGLSKRRALSVADYLVGQGVDPSRLSPIGKGMAEPLTADPYDASNRRVQFVRAG